MKKNKLFIVGLAATTFLAGVVSCNNVPTISEISSLIASSEAVSSEDSSSVEESTSVESQEASSEESSVVSSSEEVSSESTSVEASSESTSEEEKHVVSFEMGEYGSQMEAMQVGATISGLKVPEAKGAYFCGWYKESTYETLVIDGTAVSGDLTLYAKWVAAVDDKDATEATEIATVEDFLAFRASSEELTGAYKLTADLDLAGIELPASTTVLSGVFDGNGHTIKNATYASANAKSGILAAKLTNGGVIKNVNFVGCSVTSTNESAGVVVGEINGNGLVRNVEINACTITSTGNYAGLIYARSEGTGAEVNLDQITVKNNCVVSCGQYGGLITGDNVSNVTLTNSQIEGKFAKSSNNYGLLLGRTRNDAQVYKVENCVVNVTYDGTICSSCGLVSQGKNKVSTIVKNVVVVDTNASLAGASGRLTADNVYYVNTEKMPEHANVKAIEENSLTSAWYKALLTDFDTYWVIEANDGIKLKNASANVVDENDTLSKIELSTSTAKTRFKVGEEFDASSLVVTGSYASGVSVKLSLDKLTIDSSAFDNTKAGTYTITVTAAGSDISATYSVNVVAQTGIYVNDEFADHLFAKGSTFNHDNLAVYSIWSDGAKEKMTEGYNVSEVSLEEAGTFDVSVTCGDFEPYVYTIDVVEVTSIAPVVDNVVTVSVDASVEANDTVVSDVHTFKSIDNALEYLKACGYEDSVKKVINIKKGTYKEKLTISLNNVSLVGEDRDETIITYDAVESTVSPIDGKQYGMNLCATVIVNGSNFVARNISIRNDFDYKNNQYNAEYADVKESSPQGIALMINGDRCIFDNTHIYGNQDTIYAKNGRAYFKNGIVEGNIDFICGEAKGICYFDKVTINAVAKGFTADQMKNNGYVTAFRGTTTTKPNYGVIFNECTFTADEEVPDGSMSLGRPWEPKATVAYINCSFSSAYSTIAYDGSSKSRWFSMSGNSPVDADFVEYGSTGEGAISEAVTGGRVLTAEEAASYTMENCFAKENGKVTWTVDFDPTSDVQAEDNNTYYYFNGKSSTSGTSKTYTMNVNGTTETWEGMTIDGTAGKVSYREASGDTQINKGATITFSVSANSVVMVETYPGYHGYSLNGVETATDQFKVFYAEDTVVTFTALDTVYLYSIIVMPDQNAPQEATIEELNLTGKPTTEIEVGTELDLSKLVVKATMSDGSIETLTKDVDYTIDTSAVDINTAGTYTIIVTAGSVTKSFDVVYAGEVSNAIDDTCTWSFKDDTSNAAKDYIVYENQAIDETLSLGKLTLIKNGGKVSDNGDWLKFCAGAQISFETARACVLSMTWYNDQATITVTVDGVEVAKNSDGTYNLTKGNVVITDNSTASSEYIGKLTLTFKAKGLSSSRTWSFKDDTSNASTSYIVYEDQAVEESLNLGGLVLSANGGTVKNNGDWLQCYNGATMSFDLDEAGTLAMTWYNNQATITVTVDDVVISANADGSYTLPAGHVVITNTSTSTQYIGKVTLTIKEKVKAITSSKTWSFKDDTANASTSYIVYENDTVTDSLNLGGLVLSTNGGTIKDNGDWLQCFNGASMSFNLGASATLEMSWYNNQATITVTVDGVEVAANADGTYTLGAGEVVITNTSTGTQYIGKVILTIAE